jgi:hypothetical protein
MLLHVEFHVINVKVLLGSPEHVEYVEDLDETSARVNKVELQHSMVELEVYVREQIVLLGFLSHQLDILTDLQVYLIGLMVQEKVDP